MQCPKNQESFPWWMSVYQWSSQHISLEACWSPKCILKLIECDDENLINQLLDLCGLYNSKKKQYTKGVLNYGLHNKLTRTDGPSCQWMSVMSWCHIMTVLMSERIGCNSAM
jgi:hypothetical protein